jgi:hypothetical protein
LHHFAITWDRAKQSKALYLDGVRASEISGVELPADVGATLDLGRWAPGANAAGVAFDDLAIFDRALDPVDIAQLAAGAAPVHASAPRVTAPNLTVETHAIDDGGAIMSVQLAVNGVFGDPQPYDERYPLRLPDASGVYTVAARLFDRAGNSTVISTTVTLAQPIPPSISLEDLSDIGATLAITSTDPGAHSEAQVSATADFAGVPWQPLPLRQPWLWQPSGPRVAWVRFRDAAGVVGPAQPIGPDARRMYLPLAAR